MVAPGKYWNGLVFPIIKYSLSKISGAQGKNTIESYYL